MTPLRGSLMLRASGGAPAHEVWDRYARPSRWATWAPHVSRVEVAEDHLREGLRGTVVGLGVLPVRFRVAHVDASARTWDWVVRAGPLALHLAHSVQAEGTGSATGLRMTGPLPVLLAYAPVARLALRRLVSA